ncbi:MAG TPA: DMT family transporter [Symbiobacteriaceae bacterium]|nr:DMT family transporter [Symbiobacteriaceae bacterium]
MERRSNVALGTLLTVVSALGFSTLPIFGMLAYRSGANVVTLLGFRFLIAAILLWAYVLLTRRQLPDLRTALGLLIMGGVGYTSMSLLYLSSVAEDRLSPAMAALLLYTYPAIVAVLAWRFDRHALAGRQIIALLLTLGGVGLVLVTPGAGAAFTWTGAGLALGSAVVYGTYILFGSRVSVRSSPVVVTAFVSTAAALVFLTWGALTGQLVSVAPAGWWAIGGTAFFATVVAVLLFFAGIEHLGPSRASIISTLEPVGTAVLSAAIFHEQLGLWQIAGGVLVLGGIVWLQASAER